MQSANESRNADENPLISQYSSTPITRVASTKEFTSMNKIAEEMKKIQKSTSRSRIYRKRANSHDLAEKVGVDCFEVNPFLYPVSETGFVFVSY